MLQKFNPKNKDILININGEMVHRDQAAISPFDSVVQGGDAVWEGLRLYKGRVFKFDEHMARLFSSAKALGFEKIPTRPKILEELRKTLNANKMYDGVHIRLTLTRGVKITSGMDPRLNQAGPTLIIIAEHKPPVYDRKGIKLITSTVRRPPPDCCDPKIHHANLIPSILAKIEANAAGADDALMLDTRGFVAETNATNVFIVRGEKVFTPHANACPEGITRATLFDMCEKHEIPCIEKDISLSEVYSADEVFCTGTMGEIVAVIEVDGRRIGAGQPGKLTTKLHGVLPGRTGIESVRICES